MIYKNFKNKELSSLGLGCMRLPLLEDKSTIDIGATRQMVKYALDNGINYFDTAFGYHNGKSETIIGEILKDYPRESFFLATKFPGYDKNLMDKVEEIFEKQLKKCQVDYFDFYLFHSVCDSNIDGYLNPELGIFDYLYKQKQNGRIKHLGFSSHADLVTLKRFLDAYGEYMEFCQLQVNWLDWTLTNAKEQVELVSSYGIPIWVMEPVRGGSLINLEEKYQKRLNSVNLGRSNAEWAFRFLQSIPNVKMILSGMSNMEQLKENIEIFKFDKPLTDNEINVLFSVARAKTAVNALSCTSCRYCTSYCPKELDIPQIIECYNKINFSDEDVNIEEVIGIIPEDKRFTECIGCKACEDVCPQKIEISKMMKSFCKLIL